MPARRDRGHEQRRGPPARSGPAEPWIQRNPAVHNPRHSLLPPCPRWRESPRHRRCLRGSPCSARLSRATTRGRGSCGGARSATSRSTPRAGRRGSRCRWCSPRCSRRSRRWTTGFRRRSGSWWRARAGSSPCVLAFRVAARLAGGDRLRRTVAGAVAVARARPDARVDPLPDPRQRGPAGGGPRPARGSTGISTAAGMPPSWRAPWPASLRPELFGFLLLYGAYLFLRSPRSRPWSSRYRVAIASRPGSLPSWWGSGDPFFAVTQARSEPSWSLSLAPGAVAGRARRGPEPGMARARALGAGGRGARGRRACAAAGAGRRGRPGRAWWPRSPGSRGAQRGALRGDDRGRLLGQRPLRAAGVAAIAVLGGVGAAPARARPPGARGRGRQRRRPPRRCWSPAPRPSWPRTLASRARRRASRSSARGSMQSSSGRWTGGARYIGLFGPATVNRSYQTHMAWELSMPIERRPRGARARNRVHAPRQPVAGPVRILRRARPRVDDRPRGRAGRSPSGRRASRHVYTWPVQGFSLRAAAARVLGGGALLGSVVTSELRWATPAGARPPRGR